MENVINLGDGIPEHVVTFLIGVLKGMKVPYEIDPESKWYRTLKERQYKNYLELKEQKRVLIQMQKGMGTHILITGEGKDDTTVMMGER